MQRETDEKYMREALELARRGRGRTSPNPVVGAVIVKDDKVIGRGWHQKAGTHDGVDAKRLGRIDLASDGIGHDIGIGVVGNAGIVVLGQLMQRVETQCT